MAGTQAVEPIPWQAVLARDARFDGVFVYAVRSTGVYCRPSCPSRRPRIENVEVFSTAKAAEERGFRACLRCRPNDERRVDPQATLVLAACRELGSCEGEMPSAAELSRRLGTGAKSLGRAFRKVLGLTPWQYADAAQVDRLKHGLRNGSSVTEALYDAGYSSPSRLYERAGRLLGMTPAAYRDGGRGARIRYAIVDSFVGKVLVAATEKGVCAIHLGDDAPELERGLRAQFPAAEIQHDAEGAIERWVEQVARLLAVPDHPADLPLDIQATAFQRAVWEALRKIPCGESWTYGQVASAIGKPSAARAVARACATNPVAIVVPCHRVVPASGGSGGYRWGAEHKTEILKHERNWAHRVG